MQIVSAASTLADTAAATLELTREFGRLGGSPQCIIVAATVNHDADALIAGLRAAAPKAAIHFGTSCQGAMTDTGFHSASGVGLAALAIRNDEGDFGTATAPLGDNPANAAVTALESAMKMADRPGEVPSVVWLTSSPGCEEEIIAAVDEYLGQSVPILGGSAADNTVSGEWYLGSQEGTVSDGVVLTAMYPSGDTVSAFHSGYERTETVGVVTRAEGRTVYEIDGQPAAQLYNEWTDGALTQALAEGRHNVLGATTLYPLGREVGAVEGEAYFQLSHPEATTPDGGLSLFTNVTEGETLVLMKGTTRSLLSRAGQVAHSAMTIHDVPSDEIVGALVIYCAGCMLTVQSEMSSVVDSLTRVLPKVPFLGAFTFGEQGCFVGGENRHGNLMITTLLFTRSAR